MSVKERLDRIATQGTLFSSLSAEQRAHNDLLATVATRIRQERIKRGMSQKEFAKFMNVSQGMISKWESAEYNFTVDTLCEIFAKLESSISIQFTTHSPKGFNELPAQNFVLISKDNTSSKNSSAKWGNYAASFTARPSMG